MKIALMGYYPPPMGGISTHVKRMAQHLEQEQIEYRIYAYGTEEVDENKLRRFTNRRRWAKEYFLGNKEDLIHCHILGWTERGFYLLAGKLFGKKVVYTFHSYRDRWGTLNPLQKICHSLVRRFADAYIAVGRDDYEAMMLEGFRPSKLKLIPGFIPAIECDESLPQGIDAFIEKHEVILSSNASNMNFYQDVDLYGMDMCIELTHRLCKSLDVGFVFYLSDITNKVYFEELQKKIEDYGLQDNFIFVTGNNDFCPMLKRSDLFIRATNTDGDAISIREALFYKIPVLASDVVIRPEGTKLFSNRDNDDLYSQVFNILAEGWKMNVKPVDNSQVILDLYRSLLETKRGAKH